MSARLCLRIAAVILVLFAVGHTVGFLAFRPSTAEGRTVFDAMNSVHFAEGGATFTYGGFYRGFGLLITVFELFTAWLAWMLSIWLSPPVRAIAWGLCVLQVVSLVLAAMYFSLPPAVMSALAAALLATAAIRARAPEQRPEQA